MKVSSLSVLCFKGLYKIAFDLPVLKPHSLTTSGTLS